MSEDRYTFGEKVGRGGIGAVYKAYDNQLGRAVAFKRMLPPEESDVVNAEDASSSLLKEAKVLSTLNHPNIVTVFDVGADAKGVFVVMELLNGETLDETISRGVLTEGDFSEVVIQSLEALIAAQDINLVHRDIKPGNMMVVWLPSGKFQLKVLDFGLAKFSSRPSVQTSDQGDAIMGSIFFMAPEQFERGELDGRTDLYSLGCIYYHCLTGKYPFQGDTAAQVMARHLQNKMVPIEKYRPDLPVWLVNWVKWLLQRDANNRPENAKVALEHFVDKTVGHPELQAEIDLSESSGVSLVGAPARGGAQVVVAAPAAAPVLRVGGGIAAKGVVRSGTGPVGTPPSMVRSQGSGYGKWIAIGVSALTLLGIGSSMLFNRLKIAKMESEFALWQDDDAPFGNAATVQRVLYYFGPEHSEERKDAAARILSKMQGEEVDEEILRQLDNFSGLEAAALIKALTARSYTPAVEKMVEFANASSNADVQRAALNGITLMGKTEHIAGVLGILEKASDQKIRESATKAVLFLVRSADDGAAQVKVLLRELDKSGGDYRKSLATILGTLGGPEVLAKFKNVLDRGEPDYQYDVLGALMNWPDDTASDLLQKLAEETQDGAVRMASARAFIRLIGIPAPRSPGRQEEMLDVAVSLADEPKEKMRVFPILSEIPQDWAIDYTGKLGAVKGFEQVAKRTQKDIQDRVGKAQRLTSGKPLKVSEQTVGGSFGAAYSSENECITNWGDPATWIYWNVIVEEPGTYSVKIEQANDGYPGSTYEVIIGENAIKGTVRDTRDWTRFIEVELGKVNLPEPGIYTLTVKPKGTAKLFIMNLRSVTLTKS